MPDPMMPTIVRLCVAAIELAHAEREIGLRRLDQQMIVVIHQAVRMAEPAIAIDHLGEHGLPLRAIPIIRHNILPGIASTRHVVHGAGKFDAKWAGHGAGV